MTQIHRTTSIALVSLVLGLAAGCSRQEPDEARTESIARPEVSAPAQEVTVVGRNYCLGCALKKDLGAAAQCSKYGHRHALKVASATADGKELPEMKGWVLHYLDTDNGQPFIKSNRDKTLTGKGRIYTAERVLEVDKQVPATEPAGSKGKPEHPEHPKKGK